MGSPHWSRVLAGPVAPGEEPTLEQVCGQDLRPCGNPALEQFMRNCGLWEGLMLEKFMEAVPCGRNPTLEQKRVRILLLRQEEQQTQL
ncbi:hypothetical protein DUI87_17171 [Hirundo rustica rustica]|uniref:Uncharacterized protein n=1 Tax=Hirundo rustica rustica TaxID=333673 RepID=A0A3M0K8M3_HIRRU|nr:hypothetical protein DUI87_17171 [Hirundo rustica rustica]